MSSVAVLHAAQLITVGGPNRPRRGPELSDVGIIRNGGMLISEGNITAVGAADTIESQLRPDVEVIDAAGRVVMPGFVDAHTHLVFGGSRLNDFERRARGETYEQIAAAGGGIWSTVENTRMVSDDQLFQQGKQHAGWMLRGGTTTAEAKSGYGLTTESEMKILRTIQRVGRQTPLECVPTFLGAHAVPKEYRSDPDTYVAQVIDEMLPQIVRENLAEFCDVFREKGYFTLEQSRKILSAAKEAGLGVRMHADQLTNGGGAVLAAELRAKTADHLEMTDQEGIAALKRANVQPVLLPGSVYALGSTAYPRAREMIDAGLAVVIATDFNPGSSPTPCMPMVLSLACTQMKMSPAETVVAATINAAHSLNRGDKIGSLEAGKRANFVVFDCEDYREIPYWFGMPMVHSVYVRGQCVWSADSAGWCGDAFSGN